MTTKMTVASWNVIKDLNARTMKRVVIQWMLALVLFTAVSKSMALEPCCKTPILEGKILSTNDIKYGFGPFVPVPGKPQFYLKMEKTTTESWDMEGEGEWYNYWNCWMPGWSLTRFFNRWIDYKTTQTGEWSITYVYSRTNKEMPYISQASGSQSSEDTRIYWWGGDCDHTGEERNISSSWMNTLGTNGQWSSSDTITKPGSWDESAFSEVLTPTTATYHMYAEPWYYDRNGYGNWMHWDGVAEEDLGLTLSTNYTTPLLVADVRGDLGGLTWPSEWGGGAIARAYVNDLETFAELQKSQYRFRIQQTSKDILYTTKWKERTVSIINGVTNTSESVKQWVKKGNDGEITSTTYDLPAPQISESGEITVSVVDVCYIESGTGCKSKCSSFASMNANNGSVDFRLGLGDDIDGVNLGMLRIDADIPSPSLATPAGLILSVLDGTSTVITGEDNQIRQIQLPQGLVDVVVSNSYKYEVRFYHQTNGTYATNVAPFVKLTVENPDATTNSLTRLKLTENREGLNIEHEYEWIEANQGWALTTGSGLRKEIKKNSWSADGTIRTEVHEVRNPSNNALVYVNTKRFQRTTWGYALLDEWEGEGKNRPKHSYFYYANGLKQKSINSNGSWDWYEYDSLGRVTKIFSSYLTQGPTTNASLCRTVEFSYIPPSGSADNGIMQMRTPRMRLEKVLDTEVRRSYTLILTNEERQIVCQQPGAAWNHTNNLVMITKKYAEGDFVGDVESVLHPDGTLTTYSYELDEGGNKTTVIDQGEPNNDKTAVVAGTRIVKETGMFNLVLSQMTYDIVSEILTSSEVHSDFDAHGRATKITYLDGTNQRFNYSCCGLEAVIDRDGVQTTYDYDKLKRKTFERRAGVTLLTSYDANNSVISTVREGSDASQMTLSTAAYNTAGELVSRTDAIGNATRYETAADNSGYRIRTTTNPNNTFSVERYYPSGAPERVSGNAVMGVRYEYGVETPTGDYAREYSKEIRLESNGGDTSEWLKRYVDAVGRGDCTLYPDGATTRSYYNSKGQLWKTVDPDGVSQLFSYNSLGESEYTAIDIDRNGIIDLTGTDRVTRSVRSVGASSIVMGVNVVRQQMYIWGTNGANTSLLVMTSESNVEGNRQWQFAFGVTNYSIRVCSSNRQCWTTNIATDGSFAVSYTTNSRLYSTTHYDANAIQIGQNVFGYDAHGRRNSLTDARNGTITFSYDQLDRVLTTTSPTPGSGQSAQVTTTDYDNMGRVVQTTQPDGGVVYNQYFENGSLKKTYGSRTYPIEYTYDYAGRRKTMKTWQNLATAKGAAVTTWNYHAQRGFLSSKGYSDGKGTDYSYTPAGRLESRTWARGVVTSYSYNNAGDLSQTSYSDETTPTVAVAYDRQGRSISTTQGAEVISILYNSVGQIASEVYSEGPLSGLIVSNGYDGLLRRSSFGLYSSSSERFHQTYGYDAASRLSTVSDGTNTAAYSYIGNSSLVGQITFTNSGALRMTTTKSYDLVNRLTNTVSSSASNTTSFAYVYNSANQRTRVTSAAGSYWLYVYDSLGQLVSGKKCWPDDTAVSGQQFEYGYDDIGNRKYTKQNDRRSEYAANALNQYTYRGVPGYIDVIGSAQSNATVTLNGMSTIRAGEYFWKAVPASNRTSSVWLAITNVAVLNRSGLDDLITTNTGFGRLSKDPEPFTYDADGNLLTDSQWSYSWDGENRLIKIESLSTIASSGRRREEWKHLPDGRWSQRVVSIWGGSSYNPQYTNRYVWDGQVLQAILDGNNNLKVGLIRGADLSGDIQGGGGAGGVLAANLGTNGTHFATYDANGNVIGLVAANTGEETACYEYGPFGQTLRVTGQVAMLNPIRFSTQYADDVTGQIKYLYRDYEPDKGRWLSRDPIGERGGNNLYAFISNKTPNAIDLLGASDLYQPLTVKVTGEYDSSYFKMSPPNNIEKFTEITASIIRETTDIIHKVFVKCKCNEDIDIKPSMPQAIDHGGAKFYYNGFSYGFGADMYGQIAEYKKYQAALNSSANWTFTTANSHLRGAADKDVFLPMSEKGKLIGARWWVSGAFAASSAPDSMLVWDVLSKLVSYAPGAGKVMSIADILNKVYPLPKGIATTGMYSGTFLIKCNGNTAVLTKESWDAGTSNQKLSIGLGGGAWE